MGTRSSILAWKFPWIEEPGGLQSLKSQRVGHDWTTEHTHRELKFFSLRESCKNWNKSEGAVMNELELPSHTVNSFYLVFKEICGLALPWWKIAYFLLTNSGCVLLSAAFGYSNLEHYLLKLTVWFSGRSSEYRTPFQSHHIRNITIFGWRLAFGVVGGGSLQLPHDLFIPHYFKLIILEFNMRVVGLMSFLCKNYQYVNMLGFPGGANGKEPAFQCRRHKRWWFNLWVREIPWRREWQPTPIFLPEESHGQRRLAGYSP